MIDIEKFICSLMAQQKGFNTHYLIMEVALKEQGLEYKDGKIVPIEDKEREDEKVRKELFKHLKEGADGYEPAGNSEDYKRWLGWFEKQGETFTKKDVDDAYLKGVCDAKQELEKQGEKKTFDYENANIQQKDFAPQNPTWSEEDYNEIETIACHLDNIDNEGMAEVLRNIRDKYYFQTTWKPSDEQMKALNAINATGVISYAGQGQELITLYNDLKRLREE